MVQRNTPNGSYILHEFIPCRHVNPMEYPLLVTNPIDLAAELIRLIKSRAYDRQKYGHKLMPDYYEFKFSVDKDKIRVEPPIIEKDFEKFIVNEVDLSDMETFSLEIFAYYKTYDNEINGSADEVQHGMPASPTFTSTTTIPYTSTQMNFDPSLTKESSLTDVPEPVILERDSDCIKKNSLPRKSFYSEKDDKADTLLYNNTITLENSEDKKNLCNTNSNETAESNHVGLVNQAMTCYLNSLLQALFMTPEFRNALYNWEYKNNEKDSEANSIPYQLQKLFLNLQTSHKAAVETTSLTKSFGWDVSDSWHQHDIQELCRVMFDALEQKFKNTEQADLINRLYEGKINDYVKCLSCNTEKSREDTFLDIPLPVRPFDNNAAYGSVEEALEAFVKYETLEGSNQYFCEKCDKKSDAHKGLKFTKFPYILTLQLKRFDFDHNTYNRIKLNDKVTFPETLNLNAFIEPTSNRESSNLEDEIVKNNITNEKADVDNLDKNCISNDMLISNSNHLNNHDQNDDEGITVGNGSSSSCSSHNESVEKLRKDYAIAKGPYIYELFSIMIHSGSASGGHYYAYIKDFKINKWYCFNDQIVSSITKEEIQKTYGGGARTVYYSGVYRSSTNAYMLMYRQIDPERNTNPMETKDFPPHIKKLLEKMKNEEEQSYRDEQIHSMERRFKQTIYYRQAQGGEVEKTDITISMSYTLNQVVEAARKKFDLDYKFDSSQCRIVTYFPVYDLVDKTFDGKEEYKLDELFPSQHMMKSLLLDVRPSNEQFQDYPSEPIITKVFVIDAIDKDLLYCPKYVRAYCKQTVREYKQQLAKHFRVDLNTLQLYSPEILPNKLLDDDFVFDSLGSNHVYNISATDSYNEDMTTNFLGSTFYSMHERLSDVITFYVDRKDVTKEQLDNLSIPSLTEHCREVKNQENISKHYDYHSNNASYQNENQEKSEMIGYYKMYSNITPKTELVTKTDPLYNLNSRSKGEERNNDFSERQVCETDEMGRRFRSVLNGIERDQSNKEKCNQQELKRQDCKTGELGRGLRSLLNGIDIQSNKEKCNQQELIDRGVETSQTSSNQHSGEKKKVLRNNNNNNNILSVKEQYRTVGAISRSLHDLANKDKNEEWNAQETSNSEDSSLSDSDRTLIGDAPEECEFNYDNYKHCPIVMNAANEDGNNEKFFKIEDLRSQNLLKISMDVQTTEEELKKKLESFLDIPRDYFKLVDYYPNHLDELNSMTYSTSDRSIFTEDKKYVINLERILNPDEDQVVIYLLEMDSRDILGKLFTTIVKKNASIGSVKHQILEELKHKPDQELVSLSNVPYERLRFMEIENDAVGKVLEDNEDDKILPESMREICIHQLPRCRENTTRVYAIKWNVSKTVMIRWPREEIDVDTNEGFNEQIKKKLSDSQNIPEENLEFYPLVAAKDIDMNKIESAEWKSDIRPDELDFKTHLLYRDSAEKTTSLTDSSSNMFKRSYRSSDIYRIKARGSESVPVSSSPRKEKALKIRVDST